MMTHLLLAPATAWLRKAVGEFSSPSPSEKPVRLELNSLRMSAEQGHRKFRQNEMETTHDIARPVFCSRYKVGKYYNKCNENIFVYTKFK